MGLDGDLGLQGSPQLQDPSFLSSVSKQEKDLSEDLDLSFLPDELSTQDEPAGGTDEMQDSAHLKKPSLMNKALCCCHYEDQRAQDHCFDLQLWEDGLHWCQEDEKLQTDLRYSEEQSRLAARKYARVVQKLGFPAKFLDFKIQNMVGSCDVCFPIRLEGLVLTHQQFSSYEPELFPGLIYRMVKPRIVLLIFVSGKVVLTGAKERSEIYEAFENIYPILRGFRKQ
ncbi:hypothetical protein MATL_G00165370 [Megalops atlanticus]|uniref:Uncharacterized protein n=1 Tax=Megalops atlanticus TaxID=7932 RepID=A0A9D3PR82_MEGAT|nr:hypothetical protein MATL_G00165370 [Megalops atlanticus]